MLKVEIPREDRLLLDKDDIPLDNMIVTRTCGTINIHLQIVLVPDGWYILRDLYNKVRMGDMYYWHSLDAYLKTNELNGFLGQSIYDACLHNKWGSYVIRKKKKHRGKLGVDFKRLVKF